MTKIDRLQCRSVPLALCILAGLAGSWANIGHAQQTITQNEDRQQTLQQTSQALEAMVADRRISLERARELTAEIEAIRKDRATITNALIQAAKTEKQLTNAIIETEGRIADLTVRNEGLRSSLSERRALLSEVLAALQRMGLNPPPAILVKPEDALSSVRSSILLASVVPEMRTQTAILLDDLRELDAVRTSLATERARLDETRLAQRDEQARLELLVEERRALEGRTHEALIAEQRKAAELAAQARSLEGLIAELEAEAEAERQAAELARQAAEQARREAEAEAERKRRLAELAREEEDRRAAELAAEAAELRAAALRRAEQAEERRQRPRLAPRQPFESLTQSLTLPVAGRTITTFGVDDGLGAVSRGETLEARIGAIVTTPVDATVLYAGPFRAYGQLLILDAGSGYHIVLAGMSVLDVSTGDSLLAGEPIGQMGSVKLASVSAAATDSDNSKLYVEFRRNGNPVDPAPWWSKNGSGRT